MLINANSIHIPLANNSVHCVVTSPPYFHQRSYLTSEWSGGSEDCNHEAARHKNRFDYPVNDKQLSNTGSGYSEWDDICPTCGASRTDHQIGQEDKTDCFGWATGNPCGKCFTCQLVVVFREVRRVMRSDATLWLNLGDTYSGSGGAGGDYNPDGLREGQERYRGTQNIGKDKDLLLIPHGVAMALRADGWWLRAAIPWVKKNAYVDGGARDRPATKVEYIFMLTKKDNYYYDRFATIVPYTSPMNRWGGAINKENYKSAWANVTGDKLNRDKRNMRPSDSGRLRRPSDWFYDSLREIINGENGLLLDENMFPMALSVKTQPSNIPHYATFPEALVRPFILSSTSEMGCCDVCQSPLRRIVDSEYKTLGWERSCDCNSGTRPCVVLDPFCGVSTTGMVAEEMGRKYIGIDLSSEYLVRGRERLFKNSLPLFMEGV